ncbi:GGDEF domain-containing protein, partial [Achromobacter xylosoxidans]
MLRSRFSIKSLERYFLILAAGVVLPMSVLTGILLIQSRTAYLASTDAMRAFGVVRATVVAMEMVSGARGPPDPPPRGPDPGAPPPRAEFGPARARRAPPHP